MTGNLFEELIFDLDRLKTDHAGSKIEFVVSAQAVQSEITEHRQRQRMAGRRRQNNEERKRKAN